MRLLLTVLFLFSMPGYAYDLHDGHIHYNQSIWNRLSAEEAVQFLLDNRIQRAIVSSTPAEGTERLHQVAPKRIIPFLRPYRTLKDVLTWHHNPEILDYIKQMADKDVFRGFGEFHMWIEHLDGDSIVPAAMQVVADNSWTISAHTDIETIRALTKMQPSVDIIWAHCGFTYSAAEVQQLIEQHPRTHCEMSFYERLTDEDDNLTDEWKSLMEKHPRRFLVGVDTYKDARWGELEEHADVIQEWLSQLHPDAAELIANGNISRLFPVK